MMMRKSVNSISLWPLLQLLPPVSFLISLEDDPQAVRLIKPVPSQVDFGHGVLSEQ